MSFAVHFFASLLETVVQSFSLMLMENTYLLGPFYYLDVGECLILLAKELFHQLVDEGDSDTAHWQLCHLCNHICYSPGALKDHTWCTIQHGVIYGLREETRDIQVRQQRRRESCKNANSHSECLVLHLEPHTPQGWSHHSLEVRQQEINIKSRSHVRY